VSSIETFESTRRRLTDRQARMVERLADATVRELRAVGYDDMTVRGVAKRAGVAPATAYTYFGSKAHLVAEVFWRRLRALPPVAVDRRRVTATRVAAALADVALLVADEPSLAAACTTAMLSAGPDVKHLRDRIGTEIRRRLVAALGPDVDSSALDTLEMAVTGGLVQAGMGHVAYEDLPARFEAAAHAIVGRRP
jgi:AcrR family transcriptional regulator